MSKPWRTFTSLGRSVVHTAYGKQLSLQCQARHLMTSSNGTIKIQPVRFTKPSLGRRIRRRVFEASFVSLLTGTILWYFDLLEEVEDEELEAAGIKSKSQTQTSEGLQEGEKENEGENGEGAEEAELPETMPEDAIFIPLGFTRKRPQTFYKGSDPEWQSFLEFRRDRDREKAVRQELAGLVSSAFSGMKSMQKALGTPIRVRHFWIDVIIPEGPPPEYERSGIEVTDDYVAWTTRPVSSLQNARFQSALYPLPIAKSLWASFNTSLSIQYAKFKQYLNLEGNSQVPDMPSGIPTIDQLQETSTKQESQAPTRMDKLADPKSTTDSSTKGDSKQSSPEPSKIFSSLLPSIPQAGNENAVALSAFKRTLAKNWKPPKDFGGRGTLLVTGLVQLEGPKGVCVLDVAASYHPRNAKYTHVACGIRNFRPRHQRPRGGP